MKIFDYPPSAEEKDIEVLHGVEVEDNYKWLEDLESEDVKKWVKAQNIFTDQHIPKKLVEEYSEELRNFVYYTREGPRKVRGAKEFFYKFGKDEELVIIMMKDLDTKEKTVLIDPHNWSDDHTDTLFVFFPSLKGNYLVHDKVLGGDEWASSLHILDIKTGEYIDESIPNTRLASVAWRDEEGFFYTRYPDKNDSSEIQSYTERNIFYHKLGTSVSEDKLIFQNKDPKIFTEIESTLDNKNCIIYSHRGWSQTDVWLYKTELDKLEPICQGIEGTFQGNVIDNYFISLTNYLAPNGRIVKIDLSKPEVDNWTTLVAENNHSLKSIEFIGGKITTVYLEESYHKLYSYNIDGTKKEAIKLPFIGAVFDFQGSWNSSVFQFTFTSFLHPYTVFRTNIETIETEIIFQPNLEIDFNEFQTVLEWYTSKDGTKVPLFLTSKKDIKLDSSNLVFLHGYGGFNISNVPYYYPLYVFLLKKGFILAFPSLRGGGEFGEKWHKDGMLENKQNVFDDFIAAAEWLIESKYTQTSLLTIEGGSNGGLLTGAVVTQRPDLFGNVLIAVPVLDMVRFHKFYNAQPWMVEYGDPDKEDDFKFLYDYSPYHKADQNTKYPPILLTTNINDKRVHPMHAFKMTAKLQKIEKSNPVLLRTITKAGHGVVSREQTVTETAERAAFIIWRSTME
jgi:prolyl oligopeptidase